MVALKQLTVLAAFIVAAALLPAEPARALTATAHPDLLGSERLAPVQAVGQHRCHGYRNGRRAYRHCVSRGYRKPERRPGSLGTSQTYGYYKPWRGFEPCANCPAFK
jgi:hypothetical protein